MNAAGGRLTPSPFSLLNDLRQKPQRLCTASKYTALNGIGYLAIGAILIAWPGVTRQFVVASIIDRLVFVPVVLVPLAVAGVFPRLFLTFTIVDALLAIGAWVLLARE